METTRETPELATRMKEKKKIFAILDISSATIYSRYINLAMKAVFVAVNLTRLSIYCHSLNNHHPPHHEQQRPQESSSRINASGDGADVG